ncbi:MAG: hypothetical protein Q7U73_05020 [Rubrivivax sp.]|nr:hypothetical protein [Rubrivivax sp.]
MSLLNILLSNDRAEVYVDTAARLAPGLPDDLARAMPSCCEMSKLFWVAECNTVLAGRGNPAFMSLVASATLARFGDGFEGLVRAMPGILEERAAAYVGLLTQAGVDAAAFQAQEVAVVGWSEETGAMAALIYVREGGAPAFEALTLPCAESWLAPWFESMGPMPDRLEPVRAAMLAADQVAQMREHAPQAAIGGRLLRATLTRDECSMREVCRL